MTEFDMKRILAKSNNIMIIGGNEQERFDVATFLMNIKGTYPIVHITNAIEATNFLNKQHSRVISDRKSSHTYCFVNGQLNSKEITYMANNNISYNVTLFYLVETPDCHPHIRNSTDFIIILDDSTLQEVYNNFGMMFKDFEEFQRTYQNYTNNGRLFIIYQQSPSSRAEDNVFWWPYRALSPMSNMFRATVNDTVA